VALFSVLLAFVRGLGAPPSRFIVGRYRVFPN